MIKITADRLFLAILILVIISIIAYCLWSVFGLVESKYIIIAFIGIAFFGISFAGVFAGISDAKSVKQKFLSGLIGNIILNVLFLIALFYVVLTMNN